MAATIATPEDVRAIVREELERALSGLRGAAAHRPAGWATPEQAAEVLHVSAKTVRRWAVAGRLRAERHGRSWRIDRASLPDATPAPATPEEHARVVLRALK